MTRLNKQVCQCCLEKHARRSGWLFSITWTKIDEDLWSCGGEVWCVELAKDLGTHSIFADVDNVPSVCIYRLEHIVKGEQEKIE